MDSLSKIMRTFSQRAHVYEKQTNWVNCNECIDPLIPEKFGTGLSIDVCAGTGAVSKALINRGWTTISLDMSEPMLLEHNLMLPMVGDMHQIPFLSNTFDLVVCRQGLQYSNLDIAISEMARVSKRKVYLGHITKEENDIFDFWPKYFSIASPGRKRIFEFDEIEKHIVRLGFKITSHIFTHQQDYYLGPILHLGEAEKLFLVELLLDTPDEFKAMYNVKVLDGEITYSNRWEFLSFEV